MHKHVVTRGLGHVFSMPSCNYSPARPDQSDTAHSFYGWHKLLSHHASSSSCLVLCCMAVMGFWVITCPSSSSLNTNFNCSQLFTETDSSQMPTETIVVLILMITQSLRS